MKKRFAALLLAALLSLTAPALAFRGGGSAASLAVSASHAAYVDGGGVLWTWGRNYYGELGSGSQENSAVPLKIMEDVAAVSASDGVTAAVKRDGSLWMWGSNYHGQLGSGGGGDRNIMGTGFDRNSDHYIQTVPVKVLEDVSSVCTVITCTAAIKTDGSLWMWGGNQYGLLGNGGGGDRTDRYGYVYQTTPVKVMEDVAAVVLSGDANAAAAIKTDGSLWMWGANQHGQLGNGGGGDQAYQIEGIEEPVPYQTTPVKVLEGVRSVAIGANHAAAVKTDGSLWTWGSNHYGQLGSGTTEDAAVPVRVLEDAAAVSLGWSSSAAVKRDGSLWTWGWNFYGQLGSGSTEDVHTPAQVLTGVAAASWDRNYCAALKTDGSLWTWGWNYNGQLGGGSRENTAVPAQALQDVAAFAGGQTFMAALQTGGSLWTWGDNYYGQLGGGADGTFCVWKDGQPQWPSGLPFTDVGPGDWFYPGVLRAYETGMMNGDGSPARFNPGGATTRAMLAAILYRLEGQPEAGAPPFSDVPGDQWYAAPVAWAAASQVVNGAGPGLFQPDRPITRQDFAAVLFRYTVYRGLDVTGRADLSAFPDAGDAAPYARDALSWAVSQGLLNGNGGRLDPSGAATRAQTAAILARFHGLVNKV